METIVLIHGAWHGGWCWKKVVSELEAMGKKVLAPDLPGHGNDKTPPDTISLDYYVDKVIEIIDEQSGPIILVGHSMAGMVISAVAERRPEKIKTLVYVAAFLPRDGESLFILEDRNPKQTVPPNIVHSPDEKTGMIRDEVRIEIFFHDCSEEDAVFAKNSFCPQAIAPLATPVSLSAENFGSVKKVYIECSNDRAIPAALQKDMYTATPCDKVIKLTSSHSPFFSRPKELARELSYL